MVPPQVPSGLIDVACEVTAAGTPEVVKELGAKMLLAGQFDTVVVAVTVVTEI